MSEPSIDGRDVVLGLAVTSVRAGTAVGRVMLAPAALIARAPGLREPVERTMRNLAAEGRTLRTADLDRLFAAVATELTDRLLRSPEMDRLVAYVASSPELLDAVTRHTESLAEEMVDDVRRRSRSADDFVERAVRGWLRRPRPQPT
jgi:tellurite resistance protein